MQPELSALIVPAELEAPELRHRRGIPVEVDVLDLAAQLDHAGDG